MSKKVKLSYHILNFCEKGKKKEHKERADWIEEQYEKYGFPIPRLASQIRDFNKEELIQLIHWMNHKIGKKTLTEQEKLEDVLETNYEISTEGGTYKELRKKGKI